MMRSDEVYENKRLFMLKAVNLSKTYNEQTAFDSLNLNIEAGEIYCLLGANGAGKRIGNAGWNNEARQTFNRNGDG